MNLYLSSMHLGNHPERLTGLIGANNKTAITGMIAAVFLLISPGARADDRKMIANEGFFDGVPVPLDTEILMVSVDLKVLPHGEADAELIQYPLPASERLKDSCGLDSSPPVPFTLALDPP